jgi:hypothetical protein
VQETGCAPRPVRTGAENLVLLGFDPRYYHTIRAKMNTSANSWSENSRIGPRADKAVIWRQTRRATEFGRRREAGGTPKSVPEGCLAHAAASAWPTYFAQTEITRTWRHRTPGTEIQTDGLFKDKTSKRDTDGCNDTQDVQGIPPEFNFRVYLYKLPSINHTHTHTLQYKLLFLTYQIIQWTQLSFFIIKTLPVCTVRYMSHQKRSA